MMGGFRGRIFYPFLLFRDTKAACPDWIFRHELQHAYDIRHDGYIRYHISYWWQHWRKGYENVSFEINARKAESFPLTKAEYRIKMKRNK